MFCNTEHVSSIFDCQGTVVVAGRARAVVIGVGSNTAMGSIRDSMLRADDVSAVDSHFWISCSPALGSNCFQSLSWILFYY